MSSWIYLSHFLDPKTPAYGGDQGFQFVCLRSINRGDSCNTSHWTLPNHLGTHVDFPRHFSCDGLTINDYPASYWLFRSVYICEIASPIVGGVIGPEDLKVQNIPVETELLIVKTGFGTIREYPTYWKNNPIFRPEIAEVLRQRCPNLRVFGFDTISISSWEDRETGRQAHKAFLDHPKPILLLEDLDLQRVNDRSRVNQIVVCPLLVADTDGAPCTVLAEILC